MPRLDLIGKRFGKLIVVDYFGIRKRHTYWNVECDCNNLLVVIGTNLQRGCTKSCGCLQKSVTRERCLIHGMSRTAIYDIWKSMKGRCLNTKDKRYKSYGGRGITICDRWLKFEGFYEDMGDQPNGMTIERIDNDRDYNKDNCKWATMKEQAQNRRTNVILSYKGIDLNVTQWAEKLGINSDKLYYRLKQGWSVDRIFATLQY